MKAFDYFVIGCIVIIMLFAFVFTPIMIKPNTTPLDKFIEEQAVTNDMFFNGGYHFWYSSKQYVQKGKTHSAGSGPKLNNFSLINGTVVQYTEAYYGSEEPGNWDDYIYLGMGKYSHSEIRG